VIHSPKGLLETPVQFLINAIINMHLWDVVEQELRDLDVHPTNFHQLQDAILSIWANISKECFQHLVETMPRIKAVLKAKVKHTSVFLIIR